MLRLALAIIGTIAADVPVDPDSDTAQRWAREELADPIYHGRESLLTLIMRWLRDKYAEAQESLASVGTSHGLIVLAAVIAVVIVVVVILAGPVRRTRASARASAEVFVEDARTTAELRASADALAAAGRWSEAFLDRFRCLLRSLEERAILDDRPGRTAHEAAAEAAAALPPCTADLHKASRIFDGVCYGHAETGPTDDAWLRTVDALVQGTRPVSTRTAPETLTVPG